MANLSCSVGESPSPMIGELELVFIINDPVVGLGLLRTAKLNRYKAHVISRKGCSWLRVTGACSTFKEVDESRIASDLLAVLREQEFDHQGYVCFAAGDIATHALQKISAELRASSQITMDPAARQAIANKATFSEICDNAGVRTPKTWVISDKHDLFNVAKEEGFEFPVIVKAINMSGSIGICVAKNATELNEIVKDEDYDFAPLVVQEFIDGYDVGFSCLVKEGSIRCGYTQKRGVGRDSFPKNDELSSHAEKLFRAVNYSGPANIDARIDDHGNLFIIECNARFWATSYLSYLLGIDLVANSCDVPETDQDGIHFRAGDFSAINALKGLLLAGPLTLDESKRYIRLQFVDLPARLFARLPSLSKLLWN